MISMKLQRPWRVVVCMQVAFEVLQERVSLAVHKEALMGADTRDVPLMALANKLQ